VNSGGRWWAGIEHPLILSSNLLIEAQGHLATQIGSRGMALRVIGIDHGSKEKLVKDCGAEVFLDITKHDDKSLAEAVKKATGGLGASAVIVCTAANGAYAQALSLLRFGGTLVCVGMPEGDSKPVCNLDLTRNNCPWRAIRFTIELPTLTFQFTQIANSFPAALVSIRHHHQGLSHFTPLQAAKG
jgi:threonine dehydrogenase-like Zn-dependent dehydrogenase